MTHDEHQDPLDLTVAPSGRTREREGAGPDTLMPEVYEEIRRIARRSFRSERADHTLEATAVAHEAYLRLARRDVAPVDRAHLVALAAREVRRVLVDHARAKRAAKRGGDWDEVPLDEQLAVGGDRAHELLALDEALARLADAHAAWGEVVELRFFGGFSNDEIAAALGVSAKTVGERWRKAREWLERELGRGEG